jgi:hypothetical protein
LDLREVSMVGRQFTRENSLPEPTYETLDHVLTVSDWEDKFPMVSLHALECIEALFDHAPILMTTGSPRPQCVRRFMFELGWLYREAFYNMVKLFWECSVVCRNNKIRAVCKHLSGWARYTSGILRKENMNFNYH